MSVLHPARNYAMLAEASLLLIPQVAFAVGLVWVGFGQILGAMTWLQGAMIGNTQGALVVAGLLLSGGLHTIRQRRMPRR